MDFERIPKKTYFVKLSATINQVINENSQNTDFSEMPKAAGSNDYEVPLR